MDYCNLKRFFEFLEHAYPVIANEHAADGFVGGYASVREDKPLDGYNHEIETRFLGEPQKDRRSELAYRSTTVALDLTRKQDLIAITDPAAPASGRQKADGAAVRGQSEDGLIFSMTGLPHKVCVAVLTAALIEVGLITTDRAAELIEAGDCRTEFESARFIVKYNQPEKLVA